MIAACHRCGWDGELTRDLWRCPTCGGPLAWAGERALRPEATQPNLPGLWRYAAALPVGPEKAVSLGEGMTPLPSLEIDGAEVRVKLDSQNPTGSFKDRGVAVMISVLKQLGATHAVEDSSGNAGAAVAAYAARAGMRCAIFAPAAASPGKLAQAVAYGAEVTLVPGKREAVAEAAMAAAAATPGATYASHNWHPAFIEGVKTWAFEVWEQLGRNAPDAIVVPAGSGSLVLGAALGFEELRRGGAITKLPRLYAAQPAACAPLVVAMRSGAADVERFPSTPTLAEGASIAEPIRGREALAALRQTNGGAVAIEE
ncbi:MAG TPA: pyridoxal-phosphate dependent enzyme, partial [Thermomicrobiales bacterium]|nr:pyridoxal-phosphate dependent enzyme [Thermomicrobiales bacterium]